MKKSLVVCLFLILAMTVSGQNYEEFKKMREQQMQQREQQSDQFKKDREKEFENFKKQYDAEFEKYKKNYNAFLNGEISAIDLMTSDDNIEVKQLDDKYKPKEIKSTAAAEKKMVEVEKGALANMSGEEVLATLTDAKDKVERVKEGIAALKVLNRSFEVTSAGTNSPSIATGNVSSREKPKRATVADEEETAAAEGSETAAVSSVPSGKPTNYRRISSPFGVRIHPITHRRSNHKGVDMAANNMTPIYATGDGTVVYAKVMGGYGNFIKINHENGYKTAYAHLEQIATANSKKVHKGDLIGYVGSTGQSTGNHLHYEVYFEDKLIDPEKTL